MATGISGEQISPQNLGRRQVFKSAVTRDVQARQARGAGDVIRRDAAAPDTQTLIGKLWDENDDLVQKFLDVKFLNFQAEHPENETLPSYQYYSVQDYYYLVDYVQYKALRLSTYPEFNATALLAVMTTEAESIKGSTDDAWGFRNDTLIGDLKIPAELVDDGLRVGAEIAYSDWLQKNTDLGWFALHGWGQIVDKLYKSNNTTFYNTWIVPNNDPSYGEELSEFLEEYKAEYYSFDAERTWTAIFRQALQFEIDLFNSALGKGLGSLQLTP
ncbi:putative heme oxygenase-like protein [Eutypa lata UCREL1]|uniref:Putative heme oxygenase-like protein n=1 Tax=Eutypa lata (strain UCR-EL1) TaxID=1287681 RepID=M7T1Q1_EUTLA|nr:putative heme oxygenase-like protein [Eutypa lata UCREL1]